MIYPENREFGITEKNKLIICNIFAKYLTNQQVIIYGSRAKGKFDKASDVDLAIKGSPISNYLLSEIADDIDESDFPYLCDIQHISQIKNQNLIDHINRVGKKFYEKD